MSWMAVAPDFWRHRKSTGLSIGAKGLWVSAGSWSCDQLSDGYIPPAVIAILGGTRKLAIELVAHGLWVDAPEGGWTFHDWDVYQLSTTAERERRAEISRRRAESGSKGGKQTQANASSKQGFASSNGASKHEANGAANGAANEQQTSSFQLPPTDYQLATSSLTTSTSQTARAGGGGDCSDRYQEVIDALVKRDERAADLSKVRNIDAWRRKIARRYDAQLGGEISGLLGLHPEWSTDRIAANAIGISEPQLHGEPF